MENIIGDAMLNPLPSVGDLIMWWGTIYYVTRHTERSDVIIITMNNGIELPLWWTDSGCHIVYPDLSEHRPHEKIG